MVYLQLLARANLAQASPAPGGVRRVRSEEAGWKLWTKYFDAGEVRVIPRV